VSTNPIDHPYGDQAASLLSEIVDALYSGKENWSMLERLRKALHNTGLDDLREVNSIFTKANDEGLSKSTSDLIAKAYEGKMRDMLHADPSFTKIEGAPVYNYSFQPKTTTVNTSDYIRWESNGKT